MKKTFSLVGLIVIGLTLVLSPALGLLTAGGSDAEVLAIDVATTATPTTTEVPDDPATTSAESSQAADDPPATTSSSTSTTSASATMIVTGSSVSTEFGSFQVEITVENGVLVDIETLAQPTDRRSQNINAEALPAYEAQAIAAQSADIDLISGATITWAAYTSSLQAALDEAGLT